MRGASQLGLVVSLVAIGAFLAEESFARAGYPVISNSSSHRMATDVPLLIPEVNHEHVALIDAQRTRRGYDRGFIVTNPNCSAIVIVMALAPLHARFGVEICVVTTMQALSGAGYPGVPSLDATDNVIPFIGGEEEKIEAETLKLLGRINGDAIKEARIEVSAQCNRVNVSDGHMASIRVKLERAASIDDIRKALASFTSAPQQLKLRYRALPLPAGARHVRLHRWQPLPPRSHSPGPGLAARRRDRVGGDHQIHPRRS